MYSVYTLTYTYNIVLWLKMCYICFLMKVHFACSTAEIETYKSNYRKICAMIKGMGHTITRDWLEEAIGLIESKTVNSLDRKDVYGKVTAAIFSSDVVIIEGTIVSFSVGHQVTLSLSKNKPTLFLIAKKHTGKKNSEIKNSFLTGLNSPLLTIVEYNDSNLADVLSEFLKNNGSKPIVKFNIVLTKEIKNYLDWVSFTLKVNKSEFIRNLILKNMRSEDKQYHKSLERK